MGNPCNLRKGSKNIMKKAKTTLEKWIKTLAVLPVGLLSEFLVFHSLGLSVANSTSYATFENRNETSISAEVSEEAFIPEVFELNLDTVEPALEIPKLTPKEATLLEDEDIDPLSFVYLLEDSDPLSFDYFIEEKTNGSYNNGRYNLTLSNDDIALICCMVQHEVGSSYSGFPGYDFDYIQRCMARVIINRIGRPQNANTVVGVITQPGQFVASLNHLKKPGIDPNDETTRRNVMAVLNGDDGISEKLLFEMSFPEYDPSNYEAIPRILGKAKVYFEAINNTGRHLIFAEVVE